MTVTVSFLSLRNNQIPNKYQSQQCTLSNGQAATSTTVATGSTGCTQRARLMQNIPLCRTDEGTTLQRDPKSSTCLMALGKDNTDKYFSLFVVIHTTTSNAT
jgi:hypothetical protein